MDEQQAKAELEKLPEKTGVYIFKGEEVLYVGKAANIRERVAGHIQASRTSPREARILLNARKIDYIVTPSEVEALIEENILIKLHKPRYNIRLRDDKTYPYLRLSPGDYPALSIVRRPKDDGGRYFGPYGDVGAMRSSLKTLRRLFPVRTCRDDIAKKPRRPCLYYHIGLCSGPCAGKISRDEYRELVKALTLVLEGRSETLLQDLSRRMADASSKMEFERAARLRDQIAALKKTSSQVRVVLADRRDLDVVSMARAPEGSCLQVLQVREGRLVSSESFELETSPLDSEHEIIESFIKQYYAGRVLIPPEVFVPCKLPDGSTIGSWLSKRRGGEVSLRTASRGPVGELMKLAEENARAHLDEQARHAQRVRAGLRGLQEALSLPEAPSMIECFDVSTLHGKSSVGSMVTFRDGEAYKSGYRRFKIRTLVGQDDPGMIGEIVHRRYRRLVEEGGRLPDLIVVDGGVAQVNAAHRSLKQLGVEVPIIGLAKEEENIYVVGGEKPLNLPTGSEALYLLQRLRDEAHRFAVTYHRKLREALA